MAAIAVERYAKSTIAGLICRSVSSKNLEKAGAVASEAEATAEAVAGVEGAAGGVAGAASVTGTAEVIAFQGEALLKMLAISAGPKSFG